MEPNKMTMVLHMVGRMIVCGVLAGLLATLASAAMPYAQEQPLALRTATPNTPTPACWSIFELTLELAATYDNPFDPTQIDVQADFLSPRGTRMRVHGFLDQAFTRTPRGDSEALTPVGTPTWKIRFTPDVAGAWRYTVRATDRSGSVTLPEATFTATPGPGAGFIRRSAKNPQGFAYANGTSYFPIGLNMCWSGGRGLPAYETWLPQLAQAGGNWIRIWMCSWHCALEWGAAPKGAWREGQFHGVGRYNLEHAWRLDAIFDLAARHGVNVQLCLGTYGEFTTGGYFNEGQWKENPYNAVNGGPCAKPEAFWTNAEARRLYTQRLAYLAARYGARTNLFAWEFWNEAQAPAPWVEEMARYLKGAPAQGVLPADPYGHLVTTTYGDDAVWKLPQVDIIETHHYGMGDVPDHAAVVMAQARPATHYGKPHLLGEFGIDWRKPDLHYDPDGTAVNFHNGLWASVMSGDGGTAMLWWWDNYVAPKNLYRQFTPVRQFTAGIPWAESPWQPLTVDPPRSLETTETWSEVVLPTSGAWEKNPVSAFTITPFGVKSHDVLPGYLFSPGKPQLRSPLVLKVDYPRPGRLLLRIGTVSAHATLRFQCDGAVAQEITLNAAPPADPKATPAYEETTFKPEWKIYQARFNKDYGIDVPAGAHTITVENTDGDWAQVEAVTLTHYRSSRYPPINVYGLTNGRMAILWAQHARHTWKNVFEKAAITPIGPTMMIVRGLAPGGYTLEYWDTWHGTITRTTSQRSVDGTLEVRLPELANDMAVKILPHPGTQEH